MVQPKKVNIFVGNYGSGKTELAVNYAMRLAHQGHKVALVDLDIVNLYFRSRETRESLEQVGVRVITPLGKLSAADLPAISPAILGALQNEEELVVLDVGGDDVGATALGRFNRYFQLGNYNMFFVINTCRPFTRDEAGISSIFTEVTKAARLQATALISNTNLGAETEWETIMDGLQVVQSVAKQLQLPVAFIGVPDNLIEQATNHLSEELILPVHRFMNPPWNEAEGRPIVDPASNWNRFQSMQNKEGM